ncbi:hypothetical protein OKA04_14055 [Luteolibacter flavescens]|uniref:Uncharacterized protein n=1 Tax=Luteolibacter flavescens TaxID=1859460 RepID=A0ABT3FRM8_9BACT|nr:hypothetical protein [Luteolibacter flavescens]MCW1885859.1 hypothetical protein [Luteolibacter flavescens]
MERFRVSIGDEVLHTIGVSEPGVLTVSVYSVVRKPEGELPEHKCNLTLTGLDSSNHHALDWGGFCLEAGDRISIEVLPEDSFDPPESKTQIRLRDLDPAPKRAPETDEEELRNIADELGWKLIEEAPPVGAAGPPSSVPPFVSALPSPGIDCSSTLGMERFLVRVRGETHTIGVPGPGVLSVIIAAVVRHVQGAEPDHECMMELGGLWADRDTANWPKYDLVPGDKIEIEVLPEGSFDIPVRLRSWNQISEEHLAGKRVWARRTAWDLGWTLIENEPEPHSISN